MGLLIGLSCIWLGVLIAAVKLDKEGNILGSVLFGVVGFSIGSIGIMYFGGTW